MVQVKRGELERAARLGIQVRAVRDRDITPGKAGGLLAARPGRLIDEQQRRRAQTVREAEGRLRRDLADALVTSVHKAWPQELGHADIDAIDARWAAEVQPARQEARQLAGELTPEQVRARIARERDATYRAGQLLRRALGDGGA
jgi:hypothetical protein